MNVATLLAEIDALQAAVKPKLATTLVPQSFVAFCKWIGVTLTPGQAEIARVAFDGEPPSDPSLAARIFGADLTPGIRPVVAAVCGARAGKSYVLVALRLVWGMLVRDVSTIPPGQRAIARVIAPRDDHRAEVYRYALGAVRSKPELEAMLDGSPKVDEFVLRRPDGREVAFDTGTATMGGTAARGQWFTDFALDECCFFRDSTYKVNDEEIFRAATARVLPGGQVIVPSTPWAQSGLLYEMWKTRPEGVLVAHAPTLLLYDSPLTRDIVRREEARDPENARREYGAEFMSTGTTVFFEGKTVEDALTSEPFEPQPGDRIAAGGDFGFRSDSAALVLVALRGEEIHVFDGAEERPQDGSALKPSRTVATFAAKIKDRCGTLMADQHYRESIAEHLEASGLSYIPAPMTPADTYVRARMLLREGRVKIHALDFRERLVRQMHEVQGKPTSGGGMSIVHPRWSKGGHGDLCAAFVLAIWQVWGDVVPKPKPAIDSKEAELERKKARFEHFKAEAERPHWRAKGGAADRGAGAFWRRG